MRHAAIVVITLSLAGLGAGCSLVLSPSNHMGGGTDGSAADGGMDAGHDAATDTGPQPDMGPPPDMGPQPDMGQDAGPNHCNPVTNDGCAATDRCAWVTLSASTGELRCVPGNGTIARGDACTTPAPGPDAYDDCQRGLVCVSGHCQAACTLSGGAGCTAAESCIQYSGLFDIGSTTTYGACVSTCDPLTQLRPDGSTCGAGQGCYAIFAADGVTFTCARAGTTPVGADIVGTVYANSCVPGAVATLGVAGTPYCTPFCRPIVTSTSAPSGAEGMTPYSCGERGAPMNECLFTWLLLDPAINDPRLATLGYCFNPAGRMIDTNGDGTPDAPWPLCASLAPTDTDGDGVAQNVQFGCGPHP